MTAKPVSIKSFKYKSIIIIIIIIIIITIIIIIGNGGGLKSEGAFLPLKREGFLERGA